MDSLGDRIKRYEAVYTPLLQPRTPLFIRVDGRAFHTWTRGFSRPFDMRFIRGMVEAAKETAREMQGFKLAYVQSDEVTFMLSDFETPQSQGWFGYELNKVVSTSAALMSVHFNRYVVNGTDKRATFDSRAFSVPKEDAPNVFVWRQKDWHRNSLQMLARAHYSHKELHGAGTSELHELLHDKGVNWADLDAQLKNGTFIYPDGAELRAELGYHALYETLFGEATE